MRVLLVDDHALFRDGLASLLRVSNIDVVGTAGDGQEALQKARQLRPDAVLMDLRMPRCDGLTATRMIKREMPFVKIIILTMTETDELLFEALNSGSSGYLLKDLEADELLTMLRSTSPESPEKRRLLEDKLTERQVEVLAMVAGGATYKEIGATLSLSERTIKQEVKQILTRLDVSSRNEAVALAREVGLVPLVC